MRIYSSLWIKNKGLIQNMKKYIWILLQRKTKLLIKGVPLLHGFSFENIQSKRLLNKFAWNDPLLLNNITLNGETPGKMFIRRIFLSLNSSIDPTNFEATMQVSQKSKSWTSEFKYMLFTTVHNSNFEPL